MPGPRGYRRERAALAELCRRLRPSVVHTHGYRPDVLDAGVARRIGIPVVTTVHGFTGGDWKNRVYEWLQCRAFRRFDAVVAVSQPLKVRLARSGVSLERIHVVPNAWRMLAPPLDRATARRALGLDSDAFVVGWVGRLSHEKGADVLLDALGHLRDLPLVAAVVGDGAEQGALVARARRLGLEQRVRWLGAVPDAAARFSAFDLFALSSRTEGSPMVVFEAMAAGVPIVATSVGGVPEMLSAEEAAFVPPEQPGALASAIRAAYQAPAVAAARAGRARLRLCRDFGTEQWCERYDAVYRTVTEGSPLPVPL
jgi:glycosyltransferase involved in cell wall biosynthesis